MKRILLLTNNPYDYPVLEGQLLSLYSGLKNKKTIICKYGKGNNKDPFEVKSFNGNYLRYIKMLTLLIGRADYIHIRGFVSGIVFYFVKLITRNNVPYVYDPRGLFIQEIKESRPVVSLLSPLLTLIEQSIINHAKSVIVTSEKFSNAISATYSCKEKVVIIYNTTSIAMPVGTTKNRNLREKKIINFAYVGAINYWHDLNEIFDIMKKINKQLRCANFYIATADKNHIKIIERFQLDANISINVCCVKYSELTNFLNQMDVGISVVRPTASSECASPIKISDYIASQLYIICNYGIGDFDEFFVDNNSAYLYNFGNFQFNKECFFNLSFENNFVYEKVRLNVAREKIIRLMEV
jgi:hypothetical protein